MCFLSESSDTKANYIIKAEAFLLLGRAPQDVYAVGGNTDRSGVLGVCARACGVAFHPDTIEVRLREGCGVAVAHGHDGALLGELVAARQFPYVCHGHTHRTRDERIGQARVVCPGALWHPRRPAYPTMAILDTDEDTVMFIRVE